MTRRDLMTLASRAAAAAGGQEFFGAWMRAAEKGHAEHSAAPPEPDRWSHYAPAFFSPAEFAMLEQFSAILIPSDDTPGSTEAHVAHYIDFVVNAAAEYAPETQQQWRSAMSWLTAQNFGSLSEGERLALVEQMAGPERDRKLKHDGFATYRLIKQSTVFAFYTSRAGLIDNLEYKGNAYLTGFPACHHPEHQKV